MWPFKSKLLTAETEAAPTKWELDQSRVNALRAWRDIGQEFEYLGRRMVVSGHSRIEFSGMMLRLTPELRARYADAKGQVHELTLSEAEALALAKKPDLQSNVGVRGAELAVSAERPS